MCTVQRLECQMFDSDFLAGYPFFESFPLTFNTIHHVGDFDSVSPPDTMLRHLLDQRTVGGKEFAPLSGQALLGFRLAPGPVSVHTYIMTVSAT